MAPARAYTRRGIGSSGAVRNTGTRVMKSSALGELVWTLVH